MPTWDASQYLKFAQERTRPAMDLAAHIPIESVREAIDLGCGPGNSTEILALRWPNAHLSGVDSSASMLAAARRAHPEWTWIEGDLREWQPGQPVDLLFSNAAFQWVPDHETIFPRLMVGLKPQGVLAIQMPAASAEPALALLPELAAEEPWRERFRDLHMWRQPHAPETYYRILAPAAARVDIWETVYLHVLQGYADLLAWVKGTAMRPYLDSLDAEAASSFEEAYLERLPAHYSLQPDGRILFPFRRMFLVAVRG